MAAVLVAVVLVLSLVIFGIIPLSTGGGAGSGPLPSGDAIAAADAFANNTPGGPWNLTLAEGIASRNSYSGPLMAPHAGPNCSVSGSINYTVAAYSGTYFQGEFPEWDLEYWNGAFTAHLYVLVVGGQVTDHYLVQGTGCGGAPPRPTPLDRSAVPSTTAASALLENASIAAFVAAHPSADAGAVLSSVGIHGEGEWSFLYTDCNLYFAPGAAAVGTIVYGAANATTGLFDRNSSGIFTAQACSLLWTGQQIPTHDLFYLEAPVTGTCPAADTFAANGCTAGDYTYRLTVNVSYISASAFFPIVVTPRPGESYYNSTGPGGFSFLTASGVVIAQTVVPSGTELAMTESFRTYGAGFSTMTMIVANDTLLLDMGRVNPAGAGLGLNVSWWTTPFGIGEAGEFQTSLP